MLKPHEPKDAFPTYRRNGASNLSAHIAKDERRKPLRLDEHFNAINDVTKSNAPTVGSTTTDDSVIRYETTAHRFLGWLRIACVLITLKRF